MIRKVSLLCLISFILFIALSILIWTKSLEVFDMNALTYVQTIIPRGADTFFSFFSLLGSFEIMTGFLVIFLFLKRPKVIPIVLFWYGVGLVIEIMGKTWLPHPGPPMQDLRYDLGYLFPSSLFQTGSSFPSGHAFRSTFIVGIVMAIVFQAKNITSERKRLWMGGLILFLGIMLLSRISLGEHWLSDILGGTLLGTELGLLSWLTIAAWRRPRGVSGQKNLHR